MRSLLIGFGSPDLFVEVNPGKNNYGVRNLEIAKSKLSNSYDGYRVNFYEYSSPDKKNADYSLSAAERGSISDDEIVRSQKAVLNLAADLGSKDLALKKAIARIGLDYAAPPPELLVSASLGPGESLEDVERDVPTMFEGFPVKLSYIASVPGLYNDMLGLINFTDKNRPGRATAAVSRHSGPNQVK